MNLVQSQTKQLRKLLFAGLSILSLLFAFKAHALDFRSIAANKTILYDAPSIEANKLLILSAGYPVEVIVNLGEWIKVRDHFGALSWVQGKQLSPKRTVLVIQDKTEMKQSEDEASALLATLEKEVLVEVLGVAKNGWLKVRHRDGITGYIQTSALWGI